MAAEYAQILHASVSNQALIHAHTHSTHRTDSNRLKAIFLTFAPASTMPVNPTSLPCNPLFIHSESIFISNKSQLLTKAVNNSVHELVTITPNPH